MKGLRGWEKGLGGPWLPWRSLGKARVRGSEGDAVDGGKYDCGADAGAEGGGAGAEKAPSD